MSEVVKVERMGQVQRLVLVCAKGKKKLTVQAPDYATEKALSGDERGFFRGTYDARHQRWELIERVAERDW